MKKVTTTEQTTVVNKFEIVETQFEDFGFEQDETSGGFDEVFFVKMKTKDAAYFEFSQKQGDKILLDPRKSIQTIDGHLYKIVLGDYTYENKLIRTLKLYLTKTVNNKSVLFIVSTSYTQSARSIINSLLACKSPIDKVNISIYKNQSGYTSVKMSINGKKSDWKYSIDDMRKHIETIKNKKGEFVSNDYTELDELFESELRTHLGVLFPEQDHIRFVEEKPSEDAAEFFKEDTDDFLNLDTDE